MKKQSQTEQMVASVYQDSDDIFYKKVIEAVVIGNREVRCMKELLEKF